MAMKNHPPQFSADAVAPRWSSCRGAAPGLDPSPHAQGDDEVVFVGEPADDPDGQVGIVGVYDPPRFVASIVTGPLEGHGLLVGLVRKIVQCSLECSGYFQESSAGCLGVGQPVVEVLWSVDDQDPVRAETHTTSRAFSLPASTGVRGMWVLWGRDAARVRLMWILGKTPVRM